MHRLHMVMSLHIFIDDRYLRDPRGKTIGRDIGNENLDLLYRNLRLFKTAISI